MSEITAPEITVAEADARRVTEQLLDVREDFEVAEGMIPGAIHIPMGQINQRLNELDKGQAVIVVCRSGGRSARVADVLVGAGFNATTMAGGMSEWQMSGLPTQ